MLVLYQTHRIFAFHPAVAHLHGLEVTSPWKVSSPIYPAPHKDLLETHYKTSIFSSSASDNKDNNDSDSSDDDGNNTSSNGDEDNNHDTELLGIAAVHNEDVRIWVEDPNQWPPAEWSTGFT
jgi:hypothetical protein